MTDWPKLPDLTTRRTLASYNRAMAENKQLREALEGLLSIIAYDDENPCGFLIAETERIQAENLLRATTPAPVDEERDR